MLDLDRPWNEYEYVAFDTETSGAYPLGSEVVEFGAVKWRDGKVIDRYQTLLKPSEPMSAFIIGIHGITNEMVADAPLMSEKIEEIRIFFKGAIPMAHHAPFDLGFMAIEMERAQLSFPSEPAICTSLLARKVILESSNHKLQTLVKLLNIDGGQAHRASDDANACLQVGLQCMLRVGATASLRAILLEVGKELRWTNYAVFTSHDQKILQFADAIRRKVAVDIVYQGGRLRNETRRIAPLGLVRNPDGDYVMALCHRDAVNKRFYLNKMSDLQVEL